MPLTQADLEGHNGVDQWLFNAAAPKVNYSSGLKTVFENGECYWLLTDILAHIKANPLYAAACAADEEFDFMNFWTLKVDLEAKTAVLTCQKDSGLPAIITQTYKHTDFCLPTLTIYSGNDGPGTQKSVCLY